ncbi:MAG TPA: arginine--tRNA ligase [Sphingobacterium sp.]|nr:arginine--tRNA ligase [Sphingobacterium sp.]
MITSFYKTLTEQVSSSLHSLYQGDIKDNQITFQETRKEFEGQITFVVFPFTRYSKKSPEETGKEIGEVLLQSISEIESFNVIKGFLNLSLKDSFWIKVLTEEVSKANFGKFSKKEKSVMIEYSSPNTNKPLHLGHIRNNLLGYSVAEIMKAYGYTVIKSNLVNDRGIHICKSMLAWEKFGNGETPQSANMKGDHLVGKYYVLFDQAYKKEVEELKAEGQSEEEAKIKAPIMQEARAMLQKWEAGDKETVALWKKMNDWVYEGFDLTYKRLGVDFDKFYYESDTYLLGKNVVEEGLKHGVFFTKEDRSVWIDLSDEGLDEKLLLRGDGTSVYMTQDMGTAQLKYDDYQMEESIYVVGNEQDYHFNVLFAILKKLKRSWAEGLFHLSYGMVDLPSGKMKSREGTVVDADELMEEMHETAKERTSELGKTDDLADSDKNELYETIGMGALKYFLLKVEPKRRLLFNPKESIDFQGHTGPFIQYTHARIKSVLRNGKKESLKNTALPNSILPLERDLIQVLSHYPKIIESAALELSPALIANYVYDLAKLFNKFYHEVSILKAETDVEKHFRLKLAEATASVIRSSMLLLGIHVPERM